MTNCLVIALCLLVPVDDAKKRVVPKIDAGPGVTVKDGVYSAIADSFKLDLAAIGATAVKVTQREQRPGITSVATVKTDDGTVLVVVATKVRPEYPKDDSLLDRTKQRLDGGARIFGPDFELSDRTENKRRFLQYTFLHESYDPSFFPFGSGQKKGEAGKETLGIHRWFVRSGYIIEVAAVRTNGGSSLPEFNKKSTAFMRRVVAGMKFANAQ